jgi:hypothetical protein
MIAKQCTAEEAPFTNPDRHPQRNGPHHADSLKKHRNHMTGLEEANLRAWIQAYSSRA